MSFFSQRGKEYHCFFIVALLMGIVSIKNKWNFRGGGRNCYNSFTEKTKGFKLL